jgi:hypothetical protein
MVTKDAGERLHMSESQMTWGDYISWHARAKAAEQRVAELEKALEYRERYAHEDAEHIRELEKALREFPLIPDVDGYTGPRPVWAEWYDRYVAPLRFRKTPE